MHLEAYGIVTTHGEGAIALAGALRAGISRPSELSGAQSPVAPNGRALAFYAPGRKQGQSVKELLVSRLLRAFEEAGGMGALRGSCALIFASTKGCAEDFVWEEGGEKKADPFTPVVEEFLARTGLKPVEWVSVSNACASSHAAVHLARSWLAAGVAEQVIVLAADAVGPFVLQGFHALHALSPTMCRPFHKERDGLLLGEAAGVALFGKQAGGLQVRGTGLDCEGHAATRPLVTAESLKRAIRSALGGAVPSAAIAHGTGTQANDSAEDQAFRDMPATWVTASKWSVGHCLGASGLVDLVAAAEWLKGGGPFAIANCDLVDPAFRARLLSPALRAELPPQRWKSLLVTALGFGGVHSAFLLEAT